MPQERFKAIFNLQRWFLFSKLFGDNLQNTLQNKGRMTILSFIASTSGLLKPLQVISYK